MRRWRHDFVRAPRDCIQDPEDTGYRALHFVVRRDGRSVEVQLRTVGQQQRADAIESVDARLGTMLKDGSGPTELVEYFQVAGEVIFLREYGEAVPRAASDRFRSAHEAVLEAEYYNG